jgi:chloride channel 3/4/5
MSSPTVTAHQPLLRKGSISVTVPSQLSGGPSSPTEDSYPDASRSYGTIPRRFFSKSSLPRRNLSQIPILNTLQRVRSTSFSATVPFSPFSPGFRDLSFARLSTARPISTYDEPLQVKDGEAPDPDAKVNGIRVWYSSFTSIDWLHDAIKDSVRFSKLRRRKSIRSRIRLIFDKSLGWIIVTIVGFLTAVLAFLIVRSEQWLFDLKEGYCGTSWWKARRFCCPHLNEVYLAEMNPSQELCPDWTTWSKALSSNRGKTEDHIVEYLSYTFIAVCTPLGPKYSVGRCADVFLASPGTDIMFTYDLPDELIHLCDPEGDSKRCKRHRRT